jgi:hypothetical protein
MLLRAELPGRAGGWLFERLGGRGGGGGDSAGARAVADWINGRNAGRLAEDASGREGVPVKAGFAKDCQKRSTELQGAFHGILGRFTTRERTTAFCSAEIVYDMTPPWHHWVDVYAAYLDRMGRRVWEAWAYDAWWKTGPVLVLFDRSSSGPRTA